MRALCLLNDSPHYRKEAFCAGLSRVGYRVENISDPGPDDLILTWNRYGRHEGWIRRFEAVGAKVLIAENGWLGHTWRGQEWFALSKGHHAGAGTWMVGGAERWDGLGVELAPWRLSGERVILGQRGFGEDGIACPDGWAERIQRQLSGRIRPHPGKSSCDDLEADLKDAGEVVTWNSGAALKALLFGIPVRCAFPSWIGMPACAGLEGPLRRDDDSRLGMFRRLAWAMWRTEEIAAGAPFR